MAQELSEKTRRLITSRIEDFETLTQDDRARASIKIIAKDFHIYCERNLVIKDKQTSQIVPFRLNWAQELLVERVLEDLEAGRPVRYIILKARQMGLSTVIEALCFWWTATHRFVNSVIIAHETDASGNLYKMFRRYYDNCHPVFQPDRKYNTKKDLVFDVEDSVKQDYKERGMPSPGLGSEIKTLVAKEGKGRSDMINFFHGSEVAFWDSGSDVLSGALQAVPLAPNTFAFLESTANGVGGYFYDEWQYAKKGESVFKPLFFAWHEHWEYELPGRIDVYDEEEDELLEIFREKGYPEDSWDRKLLWRREKKKEFRAEPAKFYQEYPKDDIEAFLASGRPAFDMRQLMRMEERALKADAPRFAELARKEGAGLARYELNFIPVLMEGQDPTPLKIWDAPKDKDEKFTIAVDVSEGILEGSTNDYSVVDVMRQRDLKTVARWRGHIDPDLLSDIVFGLGVVYNWALVGVEINNHGLTTVQGLRNKFYHNLYQRENSEEEQFQTRTSKMGWKTDRKTKPLIVTGLQKAIRENDIIDLDVVFIRECMTFVRDDEGKYGAQEGMFDDCVIAKAINLQLCEWNSYDTAYATEHIYKPTKKNQNATNSDAIAAIAAGNAKRRTTNTSVIQRRRESRRRHSRGQVR